MLRSDFEYDLPPDRIAQYPVTPRDSSRLLALPPAGPPAHETFRSLPRLLAPGDLLVVNDSRVVRARLLGRRAGGGEAEVFLLRPSAEDGLWEAFVRPGKRLREGARVMLGEDGDSVEIVACLGEGRRLVRAVGSEMDGLLKRHGHVPLPPYIGRPSDARDARRYQTVYAREGRSVAAPTAGLHFTPRVLASLGERGIAMTSIRLDVGPGTFKPVSVQRVEDHVMDHEPYVIEEAAASALNAARKGGRRIIAVGTTVTRTLEDQARRFGGFRAGAFETDLFITPGFRFGAVSGLVTNFHLPGSTLIMLVAALAGRERVLEAYREAVGKGYRFYSYGDAMLVWGSGQGHCRT
jgi:S-adenosylmethionine:tRNA ribosyltransferase-isomerase